MKQIRLTIAFVLYFLILGIGVIFPVDSSFAQTSPTTVSVTTDKTSYILGESIIITITAVNNSDKDVTLNFSSSKQTDYVIDGKFRWSIDKYFLTVLTDRTIPAHGKYAWTMTHQNSDYSLTAGAHTITGEVVGYGSANIQIMVGSTQPVIPLSITTASLPFGIIGVSYSASVSASGGSDSYVWSVVSGFLPAGLFLHQPICIINPCQAPAEISGTPTTAGTYTFTILVSNGASKASKEFTVIVVPPPSQVKYFRYVTTDNAEEWFIVKMTNPATIQQALDDLRGQRRLIVSGIVSSGNGGFNSPWSWHLDPATILLSEIFIEVCDARPSYVEAHLAEWLGQGYCPWGARVNEVYDTPPTLTTQVWVNIDALNVRQAGALSAPKISLVREREILTKLEEKNGWIKVQLPNNQIGWVFGQYVTPITTEQPVTEQSIFTTFTFGKNLSVGMSDKDVEELQKLLALDPKIYPEHLITGYFGPLTSQAVIRFQEKYANEILTPRGLTKGTGFVGTATLKKLNELTSQNQDLRSPQFRDR